MSTIKIHVYPFTEQMLADDVDISAVSPQAVVVEVPEDTALAYVAQPGRPNHCIEYVFPKPEYEIQDDKARGLKRVLINGVMYKAVKQ